MITKFNIGEVVYIPAIVEEIKSTKYGTHITIRVDISKNNKEMFVVDENKLHKGSIPSEASDEISEIAKNIKNTTNRLL